MIRIKFLTSHLEKQTFFVVHIILSSGLNRGTNKFQEKWLTNWIEQIGKIIKEKIILKKNFLIESF